MKAMIFAAGLGTRLVPFTQTMPKAMVPVAGKPMIQWTIEKLIQSGFDEIIINVHHFAGQIIEFVRKKNSFGIRIEFSDETDALLETGGGLLKASWFFDDNQPFLVHNVDVVSDIDTAEMFGHHAENNAIATLAVSRRKTSRYFLFDTSLRLRGWKNINTGEEKIPYPVKEALLPMAFGGIHVISPEIFPLITEKGRFSINDVYLRLSGHYPIRAYQHDTEAWFDMGKPADLAAAGRYLEQL
ncbi:MAG TPA: nucleotidyltransferase family protein [Bacteroidales bacterium]|nr:nucleotidyltransferase family protein [Bacteroidales bacterium]HPT01496.1 nucleotidyltransferase family protein [Bacteroidales bacterium]